MINRWAKGKIIHKHNPENNYKQVVNKSVIILYISVNTAKAL